MRVVGTPHNDPRFVSVDQRDIESLRERVNRLEAELRQLNLQMAMVQEGVRERLDVFGVLLDRLKAEVARKDV